ncbi:toll/interleukin-1 receptor domain-containing protein [Rhizobium leguminosarum]|uniref:toll/interleukin-1 receptor domain-containing protein n=1 Tax=Rhizobium leguminosarum TaxID=384 RepID=UPI001C96EDD5|nr:toll/interleukin-1 receptor domain-containing protein [Rhizobium leguminosarum]MBY5698019.1 TIR domain-containing protein [Rhizobium leguminosarum]
MSDDTFNHGSLISRLVDWVFGFDFFLSYNHGDGKNYPGQLKRRLEKGGFRVFLDQTEYVAGLDLRRETGRHVRRSRKLVVVGRAGALKSPWVKREVDAALANGKIPVIININGAIEAAACDAALAIVAVEQHWLRLNEPLSEHDEDAPSENTISELIRGFEYTRQETKRQRFFAIAAGVFAIAALVAVWQAIEANTARIIAETQRDRAQRILDQVIASGNRSVQSLSLQVQKAKDKVLADHVADPAPETSLSGSTLDRANFLISQGVVLFEHGDPDGARKRYKSALAILPSTSTPTPEIADDPLGHFVVYNRLADAAQGIGDSEAELDAFANALSIAGDRAAQAPASAEWQERLALLHLRMGTGLLERKPTQADTHLNAAIALLRRLKGGHPQRLKSQEALAEAFWRLGDLRMAQKQPAAALSLYQGSLSINEHLLSIAPSQTNVRSSQSVVLQRIVDAVIQMKNPHEALRWADRDVAFSQEFSSVSPDDIARKRDLASSYDRRARILDQLGDNGTAIKNYNEGIDQLEAATAREDASPMWRRDTAAMLESMAKLRVTSDPEGAIAALRRALSIREGLAASQEDPRWQNEVATSYRRLTELMLDLNREADALEIAEQYLLATIISPDRQNSRVDRVGRALGTLCWSAINTRNFPRAVWAGEAATMLAPDREFVWQNYAHALMFAGDREKARKIYLGGPPLENKNTDEKQKALKQWRDAIGKDFDELQQRNLKDSLMMQVRSELGL